MKKTNIAVFASGNGSNFEAIAKEIEAGRIDATVSLLICDKAEAKVLDKADALSVPVFVFNPKEYPSKSAFEEVILEKLQAAGVEWIILAGYMRLIGSTLLNHYPGRIINIHPSLLPSFPGKDAIGQALAAGAKVTGVTIHYVDEGMDTGEIIDQESLRIQEGEEKESLQRRIQAIEHRLFPETIQRMIKAATIER